jgi:uncharacterized membrane protein
MRAVARIALLVVALICFVVAVVQPSASGRPVLTWIAVGLAFVTASLLVGSVPGRR